MSAFQENLSYFKRLNMYNAIANVKKLVIIRWRNRLNFN